MRLETLREKLQEVAPQDYEKIDIQTRRRSTERLEIFLMSGQKVPQKKTQWRAAPKRKPLLPHPAKR
jgi:tRNA A37 N6-isopentenylltransferase MiaA